MHWLKSGVGLRVLYVSCSLLLILKCRDQVSLWVPILLLLFYFGFFFSTIAWFVSLNWILKPSKTKWLEGIKLKIPFDIGEIPWNVALLPEWNNSNNSGVYLCGCACREKGVKVDFLSCRCSLGHPAGQYWTRVHSSDGQRLDPSSLLSVPPLCC